MGWRRGRVLGVLALVVDGRVLQPEEEGIRAGDRRSHGGPQQGGQGQAGRRVRERARTKAVANGVLQSGEPIWVQAGKSRMLHLPDSVRRVSIGNPEMAGVVVLGPRTIMINAKPFERERQARSLNSQNRTSAVTNRTLTPEPRVLETNFMVWGAGDEPSVHSLFVADFIDRQVLEVTVAEINRTSSSSMASTSGAWPAPSSLYFAGGGVGRSRARPSRCSRTSRSRSR